MVWATAAAARISSNREAAKVLLNKLMVHILTEHRANVFPNPVSAGHRLAYSRDDCHHGGMQTVFEAAGGNDGLRRLADAWHRRVMADEVVGHAFSHGFHRQHVEPRRLLGRGTGLPQHVFRLL